MATLEKIRQRKKILAIVIGAALLAFIIEVGIEALGRQAGNSTAAKVGSEKIDIMAFQRRVEQEAAKDQNNPNSNQIDQALRQQQVLEEMINEKLLDKEYEAAGIYVSDAEISDYMIGQHALPMVQQFAQQCGAETPQQLFDFISNPQKYNVQQGQVAQLAAQWEDLKNDVVDQIKLAKLSQLVAGGLQANDLDRKLMAEDEDLTYNIEFVKKDYSSLADDKYTASDADLRGEWQKMKEMFRLEEPVRMVHFIAVDVAPSPKDIAMADSVVNVAYAALQKGTGIDSVRVLGQVRIDTVKTALDKITDSDLKSFASTATVGATDRKERQGNTYRMYKLMNKAASIDSVNFTAILVSGKKSLQDSVLAQLRAGADPATIAQKNKSVSVQDAQWGQVASSPDSIRNKFAAAPVGGYFVLNSIADQGAQIIKVNEMKAPKMFYTLATITYDAYASTETSDAIRDKFQDFLNKNKSSVDFAKNAAKAGYNAVEASLTPSTPQLGVNQFTGTGIRDTRKAVKWAFDNDKFAVSPIFTDNKDKLVAIAVDEIYDGDYMPYTNKQVADMLKSRILASKKGDDLMAQYKGKANDLAGYAKLMGANVDTTTVSFASNMIDKIGNEGGLIGRIAGAKVGAVTGPVKGDNGVYVFKVTKQDKSGRKATDEELTNRFMQSRGLSYFSNPQMLTTVLRRATKIKKSLIDFY